MDYISENLSVEEVMRVHGDALPQPFHPVFEKLILNKDSLTRLERLEELLADLDYLITGANWRTGKKEELKVLVRSINEVLYEALDNHRATSN